MTKETLIKLMELFEDYMVVRSNKYTESLYKIDFLFPPNYDKNATPKTLTGEELKAILEDKKLLDSVNLYFVNGEAMANVKDLYIDFDEKEFNEFVARFMEDF